MSRLILLVVGGVALLSAAYLGFVKFAFAPEPVAVAAEAPAVTVSPASAAPPPVTPVLPAAPARPAEPAARPAPQAFRPRPAADTSAAPVDSAAVRRLTIELAERTRRVAHVGKPVARHVASDALGLGDDGCTVTDGVRLCLVGSPVGGWQVVGAAQGYAITARGPARLGEPLAVRVVE